MSRLALLALRLLCLAFLASPAHALDPQRSISQYYHRTWTARDGVPSIIYGLAQDRDGYIWIASAAGLYRFDGISFEHIALAEREAGPSGAVALLVAQDGSVWASFLSGGIAVYRDGVLQLDRDAPRVGQYASGLTQTRDGTIWATFNSPESSVHRYKNGRWTSIGPAWGLPRDIAGSMVAGRDGSLWLMADEVVYRLPEHGRRFDRVVTAYAGAAIGQDGEGRVWLSNARGTRPISPVGETADATFRTPPFTTFPSIIRFDRDGNLWAFPGRALFRIRGPSQALALSASARGARVEPVYDTGHGLTSDNANAFLEDREGNIWVGTSLGLDQFRNAPIVNEPVFSGLMPRSGYGMLSASDGAVYIGVADGAFRIRPGGVPERILSSTQAYQICEDANRLVWIATNGRAYSFASGRLSHQGAWWDGHNTPYRGGCALDNRNMLWMNNTAYGMSTLPTGGGWIHHPEPSAARRMSSMTRGSDGHPIAWMIDGALVSLREDGIARVLLRRPWPGVNFLYQGREHLYLGGLFGLGRLRNGRLEILEIDRFHWLEDVMDMVELPDGQTWMIGLAGVIVVPTLALDRAFAEQAATLEPLIFGIDEGLPNTRTRISQHGVIRGGDGRLWFATLGNVAWVDPGRLYRNDVPPPVHVRGLTAGGVRYRDPRAITLPRGTSTLSIEYAGLSMTIPERVRFRYRMEGVDEGWIDAGNRREASYNNLGAGTYRFRVLAANNDGVWNSEGAALEITIPPTFRQSIWFTLLCLAGAGLLAWLLYRFRVGRMRAGMQRLFEARLAERERIARELHDTLLQSVQGLTMFIQSLAPRVAPESGLRESIAQALDHADATLIEGRDRVTSLRGDTASRDLPGALGEVAAGILAVDQAAFHLTLEGPQRPLQPLAAEEVLRILEEAIRNAAQHAAATRIDATIQHGAGMLRMTIADDGIGIPEDILRAGGRDGHFGLVGMRERAALIGGRVAWARRPSGGTIMTLSVPAKSAYREQPQGWLQRLTRPFRRTRNPQ